jgi:hypothetical protein
MSFRPTRARRSRADYLGEEILPALEEMSRLGVNTDVKLSTVVDLRSVATDGRDVHRALREAIDTATRAVRAAETAARAVIAWENEQLPGL